MICLTLIAGLISHTKLVRRILVYVKNSIEDEDADEIDIAFQANDEEYW